MFNIVSYKGNENQHYTNIPSDPNQNDKHQENKQQMLMRMQGKGNPVHCWWECKLVQPL
jgi:hypothetical protein